MIKKTILILFLTVVKVGMSQSFNQDKTAFANFVKRMYAASSFEGVKIVSDYDHQYLISVISLEKAKYTSPSIMNRVAQVKGQQQASTFLNGSVVSAETVITTTDSVLSDSTKKTIVKMVEVIKENSVGFVNGLELLNNFENNDATRMVFIFSKEMKKD